MCFICVIIARENELRAKTDLERLLQVEQRAELGKCISLIKQTSNQAIWLILLSFLKGRDALGTIVREPDQHTKYIIKTQYMHVHAIICDTTYYGCRS